MRELLADALRPAARHPGQLGAGVTDTAEGGVDELDLRPYEDTGEDRRAFIREAATRLFKQWDITADKAWTLARELWAAKPEDC